MTGAPKCDWCREPEADGIHHNHTHMTDEICCCNCHSFVPPDAQPEAGEEIVLHRLDHSSSRDDWEVCPGHRSDGDPEDCSTIYEHAVATIRRKP